jgi:chemotaxis protein methyltransferase CheR
MEIADGLLNEVSTWVDQHFGLNYPRESWPNLEREIYRAAEECGRHSDLRSYIKQLLASELSVHQMEVFITQLTVGETYFFREPRSLDALAQLVIPDWTAKPDELTRTRRIWSAGCSSGEEPYSIAMLLSRLHAGSKPLAVDILATDINSKSVRKALAGSYNNWSFRGTPAWVKNSFFQPVSKDKWMLDSSIKRSVRVEQRNLMPSAAADAANEDVYDLILCRNVLMYLTAEAIRNVVRQFHRLLAPGGWLMVGLTETSQQLFAEFETVRFNEVTLYRKRGDWTAFSPSNLDQSDYGFVLSDVTKDESLPDCNATCDQLSSTQALHSELSLVNLVPSVDLNRERESESMERDNEGEANISQKITDTPQIALAKARDLAGQGDLGAALACCDEALSLNKMAALAHYLRATILQEQELYLDALQSLYRTVYVNPEFILGHFALGNSAQKCGMQKEASRHFANVLRLLAPYKADDTVPDSEGLSVGSLREMIISASTRTAKKLEHLCRRTKSFTPRAQPESMIVHEETVKHDSGI